MKDHTTEPGAKSRFIRALRDLADYLDRNTCIPVPTHGATLTMYASPGQDGRAQVDHVARLMDTSARDETAHHGYYWATRTFGPLGYEIVAIPEPSPVTSPAPACYQAAAPDTWT
jgi:hypothetical protein